MGLELGCWWMLFASLAFHSLIVTSKNIDPPVRLSEKETARAPPIIMTWMEKQNKSHDKVQKHPLEIRPAILDGQRVKKSQRSKFGYQLSLSKDQVHVCGAVIIGERSALSAAHCFSKDGRRDFKTEEFTLIAGERDRLVEEGLEKELKILKIILHPNYTGASNNYENDIAFIRVAGKFEFNSWINRVRIPLGNSSDFAGYKGTASGWGYLRSEGLGGGAARVLQMAQIPILSPSVCAAAFAGTEVNITEGMLCVQDKMGGSIDVSDGDSGGPLVVYDSDEPHAGSSVKENGPLLVGLASWTVDQQQHGSYPSVFTRVSRYRDWLESNVGLGGNTQNGPTVLQLVRKYNERLDRILNRTIALGSNFGAMTHLDD